MRTLVLTTSILASALANAPVLAQPHRVDDVTARGLTAEQVHRYATVYYPAIRACYLELGKRSPGATGELAITLVIHRAGHVHDVSLVAPGVRSTHLRKLEGCVRMQVIGWHFPVRRDFTTAVLPYQFVHLAPPGAGPQYSCWSPRGCPSRPAKLPRR